MSQTEPWIDVSCDGDGCEEILSIVPNDGFLQVQFILEKGWNIKEKFINPFMITCHYCPSCKGQIEKE